VPGLRTIIKHANRRLYDATEGRTITLLALSDIVVAGEPVSVIEKVTGEDITAVTLLQSLLERLKRANGNGSAAGDAELILEALRRVIANEAGEGAARGDVRESVFG
jgi:polyhydroxyalkanoate synthesis regulator protein